MAHLKHRHLPFCRLGRNYVKLLQSESQWLWDWIKYRSVLIVERCGIERILCTLALNTDGLCHEIDWRDAILCDWELWLWIWLFTSVIFTAQCHDVILYQFRWLHFSNTAANRTWFTVYPLLYCGNRWPIGTAYSCIWTPNMVRHNICWHNYAVEIRYDTRCYFNVRSKADISQLNLPHGSLIYRTERGLVVGFCGQPHYCYRPYYPTARFWSPSSYMASDEPFPDRSRPMSC